MLRRVCAVLSLSLLCAAAYAQGYPKPREDAINSSGSGTLKVITYEVRDARATLVMLPGGTWNVGAIDPVSGMLDGSNFFVRTIPLFLEQGFNVVTMFRPENSGNLQDSILRASKAHRMDVVALSNTAQRLGKPVWMLGTSLGAISAVNAVTSGNEANVAGLVISAAVANKNAVQRASTLDFPLEEIRLPVYVSGHEKDQCETTPPSTTREIAKRLTGSKNVVLKMTQSGSNPTGNPCGPTHWHGYINAEAEVVKQMAEFIRGN